MLLLVFDLSNVVLNFFDHGFKLGIFLGFILKFDCEFLDGVFQELERELVLTFQLDVENGTNGDFHFLMID